MSGSAPSWAPPVSFAPRRALIVIGPTPPPVHGMTTYTAMLLRSPVLAASYRVLHVDTSDRRTLENMGRLDLTNVRLALAHAATCARLLRRERPDVVLVFVSQNAWAYLRDAVFMALAHGYGCRVVTQLHGGHFGEFYRQAHPVVQLLVRRTSRWVAAATVLGEGLRSIYRGLVPEERVRVVPNGVEDPFEGQPPERAPHGPPLRVTYLGTLHRPKGILEVVEAARLLEQAGEPFRFRLAGGWLEPADEAAGRAAAEGVASVEFVGVVEGEAKRRLLAESDVVVLPSAYPYEGQPLVILEAMAAGLPVIATPRAAIPDMVVDGVTGVLIPEKDSAAVAGALRRLAADPAARLRMGKAARARYEAAFTAEACVARLVGVLDDVCRAAEPARA